jgi:hypothetical protein
MADAGAIRAGQAFVEIAANDADLVAGLKSAEARLKQWSTAAKESLGEGGLKTMMGIATPLATIRVATLGLNGVFEFGRVALAAYRGDLESLQEAAYRLPFGLGQTAQALDRLVNDISGYAAGVKSIVAEINRIRVRSDIGDIGQGFRDKTSGIGGTQWDAKRLQIESDASAAWKSIREKALEQGILADTDPKSKAAISAVAEWRQKSLDNLKDEQDSKAGSDRLAGIVKAQDAASQGARAWEDALFGLSQKLAQARGDTDALAAEEAEAKRRLVKELAAGTITSGQYSDRLSELAQTYTELAIAEEGQKQDAERAKTRAEGDALKESLMTPEERGRALVEKYKSMEIDPETQRRAIQKALEDAAGAAMPSPSSVASRGQFGGQNAWMLGAMGMQNEAVAGIKGVEKNTAEIARLARDWGVAQFL